MRGFIKDIQHTRQPGCRFALASLMRCALAPAQRAAGPVEIEIIKADIVEEPQPLDDLLQDGRRRSAFCCVGQMRSAGIASMERQVSASANRAACRRWRCPRMPQSSRPALRVSAAPRDTSSHGADCRLILAELFAHPGAFGAEHPPVEIADHALRTAFSPHRICAHQQSVNVTGLPAGAIEHDDLNFAGTRSCHGVSRLKSRIRVARLPSTCM